MTRPFGPVLAVGVASVLLAGLIGYGYWRDDGNYITSVGNLE